MKTSPNRIAAVAFVMLMLAVAGWWWLSPAGKAPRTDEASQAVAARDIARTGQAVRTQSSASASASQPSEATEQCGKALNAALHAHAASLEHRRDAQSQLGYALAAPFTVFAELAKTGEREMDAETTKRRFEQQRVASQQAFARARALAPDNPDIPWLAAIQCGVEVSCQGVREELLAAEPGNAAAWLREMAWARMRNDQAGVERAFRRAAEAPRYVTHIGASQFAILDALSAVAMPAECKAGNVQAELRNLFPGEGAVGVADFVLVVANSLAGMEAPAYTDIRERCSPGSASGLDGGRRAACGKLLEKMAASDSMLDQAIALGLLVELAGDGDDAARWRERYREHYWLRAHMGKPVLRQLTGEDYAFDELGAMQRALESAGLWPPPAGWLPRDELARSLIQTGRKPPESRR